MADTTLLKSKVEDFIREKLRSEYGQPFEKQFVDLTTGGPHEFDAVSKDGRIVASIKSASGKTAGGKNPSGKIKDSIAELYFLRLVKADRRILILTNHDFYQIFLKNLQGKIPFDLEVVNIPLPQDIEAEVRHVQARASKEVSPR